MAFLTVAVGLSALSATVLIYTRRKCDGGNPGLILGVLTVLCAYTFAAGTALLSVIGLFSLAVGDGPLLNQDGWQSNMLGGAITGATVFISVRVLMYEMAAATLNWSLRLETQDDEPLGQKVRAIVWGTVGAATVFAILFQAWMAIGPLDGLWLVPLFAIFAAPLPLYETIILPWLQYFKAPSLTAHNLASVETWLRQVGRNRRVPRFHIRIQQGGLVNAFAIGGLFGHLIVLGEGLVDRMSQTQIKAILAHELAHVLRRDVPRLLLPMAIGSGALYYLTFYYYISPLFALETVRSLVAASALVMLATLVLYILIPGYFMRRMEYRADRLAVDLLGNGDVLADALLRFAEINGENIKQWHWSHPSIENRVKAIRSLTV